MKFAYEDLHYHQFELLVVLLCQHLLGIAVQKFAKGPDGGRDAKFVGTAELYPSKTAPWKGTVIIQAKHTNGLNKSFSEYDFYCPSSSNNVVAKEVTKVKKLRKSKQLDHYMLFANRKLTANSETDIREHISKKCDIPVESIYLCGVEQLEIWLKQFPDVAKKADLDPLDSPLIVSPDELSEIVEAFARQKDCLFSLLDKPPIKRLNYERKNRLNNMTVTYANEQLKTHLKDTPQIQTILAAPENIDLLAKYQSVVDEFRFKIIVHQKEFHTFDQIMEYILDLLFNRDAVLRQSRHKRLTRAFLFYMYWNCDIGADDDASNETLSSWSDDY